MRALALTMLLAACGGEGTSTGEPSCAEVAGAATQDLPRDAREDMRDRIAERCHVDGWSRAVRRCLLGRDRRRCATQLTPEQRDALEDAFGEPIVTKSLEVTSGEPTEEKRIEVTPRLADARPPQPVVEVTVGATKINGMHVANSDLAERLRSIAGLHKRVTVKAAADVPYRRILEVLDLAKRASLEVMFSTP